MSAPRQGRALSALRRRGRRCAAACAALALLAASARSAAGAAPPPNLILVTIDTLRADHLGFAGYPRDTSPNLDALAREGTWFARCYTQSATTAAAHATLFTSVLPPEHGVLSNTGRFPDRPSLIRSLHERGYATAGFVSSVVLGENFGLRPHFDHFDDQLTTAEPNRGTHFERPAVETIAAARRYLEERDRSRPLFLWIHLIDPHGPYAAPVDPDRYVGAPEVGPPSRPLELGSAVWERDKIPSYQVLDGHRDSGFYVARYDAEIRYADAALGALLAELTRLGLDENSVVAVTADHGETLAEPGHRRVFSHGTIAYEEDVRVPLVIREPRGAHRLAAVDRSAAVTSMDVAPTLLDLLDVAVPPEFAGRSLLRAKLEPDVAVISLGAYGTAALEQRVGTQFSVLRGPWRYVVNLPDGSEELYDHRRDPGEAHDLAGGAPRELAELRAVLAPIQARRATTQRAGAVSSERAAGLRALGYVE